jgi:sugar-specific transcriptional regulator TrmB
MNEETILIQAGLSEEQALTYQALLDKGPQKASNIAKWTGIKRGLTYKVLEQLEAVNLVEKNGGTGTVASFSALHPSHLLEMIETRAKSILLTKETLTYSLGPLASKFNLLSGKPNVQFFEGKEAVERITGDYPKIEKEIRQWIDISAALSVIEKETVGYLEKRIKMGISKKMIVTDTSENRAYIQKGSNLTEFKTTQNSLPTAIQVYDNTVAMLTLSPDKRIGLIIEDEAIAQTMKSIFDEVWNKSETTKTKTVSEIE